ncbi:MAG: SprT-like domain-containing protein [Bacteroidia bacterium]
MRENYSRVLGKYITPQAVDVIVNWIIEYGVHLKITSERSTKLGDFRPNSRLSKGHRISVNYNLNQYAFLITLVHEMAHLITWNTYHDKVKPHGLEWKEKFREMLLPFLAMDIFPEDIAPALIDYLNNPAASSCSDMNLMRVLMHYDEDPKILLEEIPVSSVFRLPTGRVFKKGDQRRKYFQCLEVSTGKIYLINPLAEVEPVSAEG